MTPKHELSFDIETRSRTNLKTSGVYRYVEDPEFSILMCAYAMDDEPVRVLLGDDIFRYLANHLEDPNILKIAHNAAFERICFSRWIGMPTGQYLDPRQWHCTMAVAGERGFPRSLELLSEWVGGEKKDSAGAALVSFFCKPNRKGLWNEPADHPEKWSQFVEYCRQDVVAMRDDHRYIGDFPTETERQVYIADQLINDTGLPIDVKMAEFAKEAAAENRIIQELEFSEITGVSNPGSRDQVLAWLDSRTLQDGSAIVAEDLTADTVSALLEKPLDDPTRRVLELRQELALVASKKYTSALDSVCADHRLRGSLMFFGAHTGRWSGKGFQPHNLPRATLGTKDMTDAQIEALVESAILDLKMGLSVDSHTLKALVRALFIGPFTVVDYAAIEARVIAWLAHEVWALKAFYDGRDIYVETAARMSTETNELTRAQGKVAVLALGYNGGTNSLRAMGADGNERELKTLVRQWRIANSEIVGFWKDMGDAFINGGPVGEFIHIDRDGDSRHMVLPSGRAITYHGLKVEWVETEYGPRKSASFLDPDKGGNRVRTYGGRLSENATQAVARDIMAEALVRLIDSGHKVVGHVHDEVIVEGTHTVSDVKRIMVASPSWAPGLPIDGAGFVSKRYRKG